LTYKYAQLKGPRAPPRNAVAKWGIAAGCVSTHWDFATDSGLRDIWAKAISTSSPTPNSRRSEAMSVPSLAADKDKKLSQRNSTSGQGKTDSSSLLTMRLFQRIPEVHKVRRKVAADESAATKA
jgi:hypothetical protein